MLSPNIAMYDKSNLYYFFQMYLKTDVCFYNILANKEKPKQTNDKRT